MTHSRGARNERSFARALHDPMGSCLGSDRRTTRCQVAICTAVGRPSHGGQQSPCSFFSVPTHAPAAWERASKRERFARGRGPGGSVHLGPSGAIRTSDGRMMSLPAVSLSQREVNVGRLRPCATTASSRTARENEEQSRMRTQCIDIDNNRGLMNAAGEE